MSSRRCQKPHCTWSPIMFDASMNADANSNGDGSTTLLVLKHLAVHPKLLSHRT
ncbi:hypothetical protein [Fuerstiella marisgermanici]|uniref:Uncharacterized protein n=1 Tax=Fuerstiella marisgermanici TaxID=1891926 RepID=A0A1P8WQ28_9PLAN|nr:hypothetical protein [Fuerstiella marisgermanici]APZ96156.1 hypothetical protein Fuma_05824 [Fuerstiella marisgermanici]